MAQAGTVPLSADRVRGRVIRRAVQDPDRSPDGTRRRDAYSKGEPSRIAPMLTAEVVTGATAQSRTVDFHGLGADGYPRARSSRSDAGRPRDTSADLCRF